MTQLLLLWLPTITLVWSWIAHVRSIQNGGLTFIQIYREICLKNRLQSSSFRLKTQKWWIFWINWWFMNQFICPFFTKAGGWHQIEAIFWGSQRLNDRFGTMIPTITVVRSWIAYVRSIQNGSLTFRWIYGEICLKNQLQSSASWT